MVITTKSQTSTRAEKASGESNDQSALGTSASSAGKSAASGSAAGTASGGKSSASKAGGDEKSAAKAAASANAEPAEVTWTVDDKGIYTGSDGGKHYGDTQPKVEVPSAKEGLELIRMIDASGKVSSDKVPISVSSRLDTLNTNIVEVGGKFIVTGPLANQVAAARGLMPFGQGEGNPTTVASEAPASGEEGKSNETGTSG